MTTDRVVDIFELLNRSERDASGELALCSIAAEITKLDGAAIGLRIEGTQFTVLCASTSVARALMDLELQIGEGPCSEVCEFDKAVHEAYFDSLARTRWPIYAPLATVEGANAVFGFPVDI